MNFRTLLLSTFVVLSACGGGGSSDSGAKGDSGKKNLIVALGDSIAAGYSASTNFPDLVSGFTGIPVVNVSSPGFSAEREATKLDGVIDQYNPKYIIVLLGTNDALGAAGGVKGAINTNEFIANTCQQTGTICVLGTLPTIPRSEKADAAATAISDGIRRISNVRIADVRAALNASHIGPDGLHPNTDGQFIIGKLFAEQIF